MNNLSNYDVKLLRDRLEDFQEVYSDPADIDNFTIFRDAIAAIDELLACREAQNNPVAWEVKGILCNTLEQAQLYVGEPEPLYAAPPLPVVNSPVIPDGWALVPIKPTEAMRDAWFFMEDFDSEWAAMLAAAPKPNSET